MALTQLKTSGIADDAVTTDKLANAINTERTANTAKVSTTINNNADNRVITGSGTANTLNGESSVVIDSIGQVSVGGSTTAFDTTGSLNGLQGYYETDSGIATIGSYSSGGSTVLNFHTNSGGGASAERMRIDSSGRVQIGGVTGPNNAKLFVAGTNSTNYMTFRNTSAGDGSGARWNNIRFQGTQSGGEVSDLVHLQANHDGTADDEKGAFEVLINDGNDGDSLNKRIRVDSDGLKFNSDTAAANALDDYEEGTFTCTITGSSSNPSYGTSSNQGFYVRIGKFVSLYFLMIVNSVSSQGSGNWQIQGIPFSHDNNVNSYRSIGIIGYNDIFDSEVHKLYVTNSDKLLIIPNGVTQSNQTFSQNPLSTGYFGFSITYRTDS